MASEIRAGLLFNRGNKEWRITSMRLVHNKLMIEADDGDVDYIGPKKFREEAAEGEIQVLVPGDDGVYRPIPKDWRDQETPRSKKERERRVTLLGIEAREVQAGKSLKEAAAAVATECAARKWKVPSERTLRKWRSAAKQHESRLSPQWGRCGNRNQGPDELLLDAMEEVVECTILADDKFTIGNAWKLVEPRYDELCTQKNFKPRRHTRRKLTRYLRGMGWKLLAQARLDGRTARALTRTAIKLNTADLFWDVVELDATLLNIQVRDDDGTVIGRPILYIAVDVATGYLVGFHLTIQKPSVLPFIECLRYMYFPKPDDFDERYKIVNRIEVFGKPVILKVDNGTELIGQHAEAVVRELHGDSGQCKPWTPEEKPHVERMNRTIKGFVRTLPGSTTSAIVEGPRTPGENEELLTLEVLKGRLLRHIYDDLAFQPNELRSWKSRQAVASYDIWLEMRERFMEPLPMSRDEFERVMYFKRETRKLGHDGISYDFMYHSHDLGKLYELHGPARYEFLYSDIDAEMIYVIPPAGGEPVPANAKVLEGIRVDRATAKKIAADIKKAGEELSKRAFKQRLAELAEHKEHVSMRGRNQEARKNDLLRQAREAVRPTMQASAKATGSAADEAASQTGWDFAAGSALGRARGAK